MVIIVGAVAWIFALISFPFLPGIIDSFHETVVELQSDTGNITTGAGETTGNVTLTMPLYMDRLAAVIDIDSTLGTDTPAASSYTTATQVLVVSGLTASDNRVLTVQYEYDVTDEYTNTGDVIRAGPTIILISLIAIIIGIPMGMFYMLWRKARGSA